jgi:hypothetical protein
MELWVGCVAGALEEGEFKRLLAEVGFEDPEIEPTRIYQLADARDFLASAGLDADRLALEVEGRVMGAFVRARKPGGGAGAGAMAGTGTGAGNRARTDAASGIGGAPGAAVGAAPGAGSGAASEAEAGL